MIEVTGTAAKHAWNAKILPPVEQVAPLVWSIPIVFPVNSVRYTFCYVLIAPSGECVVLDPGWDTSAGWAQLLNGLAAAGQPLKSVVGIVSTHSHADHLGLVRRLTDATDAWVAMLGPESDALTRRTDAAATHRLERTWMRGCGVPDSTVSSLLSDETELNAAGHVAHPTMLLAHNDLLSLPGRTLRPFGVPRPGSSATGRKSPARYPRARHRTTGSRYPSKRLASSRHRDPTARVPRAGAGRGVE